MSSVPIVTGIQVVDGSSVPAPSPTGVSTLTTQAGVLMITPPGSSTPAPISAGLAAVASKTTLANTTGGSAVPVANSVAAMQAMLGTPANWYAGTIAFAQSKVATLVNPVFSAEFLPVPSTAEVEFAVATGTGTAALSTTVSGGAVDLTSGASAGGLRIVRNKNGTLAEGNFLVANMKTGIYAVCTRAKLTTMNATADLAVCAISDETVLTVWLGTHGATSVTNLVLSTTVVTDLGVAFPALGTYADFMMIMDGANITCYLGDGTGNNWAQIGNPVAQSTLPTNAGHWLAYAGNNATASNCAASVDKALFITTNAP